MKIFGLIVLILLLVAGVAVYADGTHLPVNHTISVTGVVPAPPDKVFALITDVAKGAQWRPEVKFVTVFHDQKRDHWVEHLAHGQFMTFLAVRTDPVKPADPAAGPETVVARRDVMLDDPKAPYGGTWTYELSPTRTEAGNQATLLKITETGFITPPLYRFVMVHVLGPTHNLDQYLKEIQAAAKP